MKNNPKWVQSQNNRFHAKMNELFSYIQKNGYPKKDTENGYEYQMYSRLNHLAGRPDLLALLSDKQQEVVKNRPTKVIKSLKTNKPKSEQMATKPKAKAAKKAKAKPKAKAAPKAKAKPKAAPKKRVIKSAKVKKANQIFAQIPDMIVQKAYDAGKKGAIKPTYKKVWHDAYRELKK